MIQRNAKNANFARTWAEYKSGFGDVNTKEFWLGLEEMHQLTKTGKFGVEILLILDAGTQTFLSYDSFVVGDESSKYALSVGTFDARGSSFPDEFIYHRGRKFSTMDQDNDDWSYHCAQSHGNTGWWYGACVWVNLNEWISSSGGYIPYDGSNGRPQETKMTLVPKTGNLLFN